MPKSVCVKCEVELKPEINGVVVVEMFQQNKEIYKLWEADLWKCPICGVEVVLGFGNQPFMYHFDSDCKKAIEDMIKNGRKVIYDLEN